MRSSLALAPHLKCENKNIKSLPCALNAFGDFVISKRLRSAARDVMVKQDAHQGKVMRWRGRDIETAGREFEHGLNPITPHMKLLNDFVDIGTRSKVLEDRGNRLRVSFKTHAERHCRCELAVAPGDEVLVRHEKVVGISPRRTTLSRTDPANPNRERVIAANIDLLVIVASVQDPPFRPGLIDAIL